MRPVKSKQNNLSEKHIDQRSYHITMKYVYLTIILLIIAAIIYASPHIYAQKTDFATLFEEDKYKTACLSDGLTCYFHLEVKHQSNSSMIVAVRERAMGLIGPQLDMIEKDGYKVQSFVPDTTIGYWKYETWIYLVK